MKRTYLDVAAASPVSAAARIAFGRALRASGNPSSPHAEGQAARAVLEDARARIARLAGVKPEAVIFTGGATEANALAIEGHIRALIANGSAAGSLHALYLPSAHASVIGAMRRVEAMGVNIEALDLVRLASQVRPETVLVAVDLVCGETGTVYDVREIRRVIDKVRQGGPRITLVVDASQAPRTEPILRERLGADLLALDAQKVGGVRGIGALIAPRTVPLLPLIEGGGQERGLRSGTESPAPAAAFATALEECDRGRESFTERSRRMRKELVSRIESVPGLVINEGKRQAPHILNVSLPGRDTDYLVALLDAAGFAVSTRSACETDEEGSRAVFMMYGDEERARTTLRISWGPRTRSRDLVRFSGALIERVRFMDENAL